MGYIFVKQSHVEKKSKRMIERSRGWSLKNSTKICPNLENLGHMHAASF